MTAYTSCNPSTGEVLFTRSHEDREQLVNKVAALRKAQALWREQSVLERTAPLLALAESLERERETLAALITLEVGRRTAECLAEIDKSAQLIRYYATLAPKLLAPQTIATSASLSQVAFEPLGLVCAVMPWNYPVWQVLRFAVPAMFAGNACLLKPAPSVPQTSMALLALTQQAGVKVFDIAWLENNQVEQAISLSNAVAFTGSTNTGRQIASLAGRHLKKSILELGGSNPFIVLADAEVKTAAKEACSSRFRDAGQSCNAAKRLILVPEIAEEFIGAFLAEAKNLVSGNPSNSVTTLSPLARADLREALHAQVLDAAANGAELLLGGKMPSGAGFFYPATVLDQVNPLCRVYHEEVFGPVAVILRAKSAEHAIRLANDSSYGLGASIYSASVEKAWELARQIEAGSVFINRHTSSDLRLPFGGVKDSGYGRELSEFGLYEFVNIKTYWQK